MAFADTPDRRVTGHLAQRFDIMGQQKGAPAHPGTCKSSLSAGVTTTDDDNVKLFRIVHLAPHQRQGRNHIRKGRPNEGGGCMAKNKGLTVKPEQPIV